MLTIAYSDGPGYYFMVNRMRDIIRSWDLPFKAYDRNWLIHTQEYKDHRKILDVSKGGGYWAWKPLIILDALQEDAEVLYLDSSVIPTNKDTILELMKQVDKISAIRTEFINGDWTKRSCFRDMNCDSEEYWKANQIWAGVVFSKAAGKEIVEEWRNWCLTEQVVTDCTSQDNLPGFRDHRHDQSILTNLLVKYRQEALRSSNFLDVVKYG